MLIIPRLEVVFPGGQSLLLPFSVVYPVHHFMGDQVEAKADVYISPEP